MSSLWLETCWDSLFFHQASRSLFLPKIKIISLMIKQHTTWVRKVACLWLGFAKIPRSEPERRLCRRSRFPPVDEKQSLSLTLFFGAKIYYRKLVKVPNRTRHCSCGGRGAYRWHFNLPVSMVEARRTTKAAKILPQCVKIYEIFCSIFSRCVVK